MQRTETFSGVNGINQQDRAVQESMGPIVDRTRENLGPADRAVVATRRLLLEACDAVERGGDPRGTGSSFHELRAAEAVLGGNIDWRAALLPVMYPQSAAAWRSRRGGREAATPPFGDLPPPHSPCCAGFTGAMISTDFASTLTPARRQIAFYLLLLSAFMPTFNTFAVTIALPVIRDALRASAAEASLIVSGYSSAYAVCLVTGGRLGDLYGHRRMFLVGMAGFALLSLGCGVAPNIESLIICRVFQGVFGAMMAPPVLASLRLLFLPEEIPWALNVYGTAIGVAVAAGQFLGGMLISADLWGLGWRTIFLLNLPVCALALLVVPFLVPESGSRARPRLDYGGVALLSAALGCFIVPLSIGRGQGWAPWVLILFAASVPLTAAFLAVERSLARRGGMPILDAGLMRIAPFRLGLVVACLFFFTSPFYVYFSLYLQAGLHATALAAGLAVLPYGIANFVAPMPATRFPRPCDPDSSAWAWRFSFVGYGGVALRRRDPDRGWPLFAAVFIAGFGQGFAMPEMINTILAQVPREAHRPGLRHDELDPADRRGRQRSGVRCPVLRDPRRCHRPRRLWPCARHRHGGAGPDPGPLHGAGPAQRAVTVRLRGGSTGRPGCAIRRAGGVSPAMAGSSLCRSESPTRGCGY